MPAELAGRGDKLIPKFKFTTIQLVAVSHSAHGVNDRIQAASLCRHAGQLLITCHVSQSG